MSKLLGTVAYNDDGQIICDREAAEFMNDYYVNLGAKLAETVTCPTWKAHAGFPKYQCNRFSFRIVTEKECLTFIKQIDISKSSAFPDINTKYLKDAFLILPFEITYLLNQAVRYSEFGIPRVVV